MTESEEVECLPPTPFPSIQHDRTEMISGFLQQLPGSGGLGVGVPPFNLPSDREIFVGRDPANCQLVLDINFSTVSRRHACLRPAVPPPPPGVPPAWEICDLNSANGTFINGERLIGCRQLQHGDRILLGNNGPEFLFQYQQEIAVNNVNYPPAYPPQPNAANNVNYTPAYPPNTPSSPPQPNAANNVNYTPAYPPNTPSSPQAPISPPLPVSTPPDGLSMTQLFPILSTGKDLKAKAFLVPGILMSIFVVAMFASIGSPGLFNLLLALAISTSGYYFVYQLCGKVKPWWWLVSAALLTGLLLIFNFNIGSTSQPQAIGIWAVINWFFRDVLPGDVFGLRQGNPSFSTSLVASILGRDSYLTALITNFFGAGLAEELLKAIPVFVAVFIGIALGSKRLGVWEPLDGILIGAASAVGFTLLETLGQYVPNIVSDIAPRAGVGTAELVGLQLLIPRILGSVAGHMAYSGYFGYFIGLSQIRPANRWQILTVGYVFASGLHALWNSASTLNEVVSILVGIVSYMFLASAILKARLLSPNRSQNFATRLLEK